MRRALLVFMLVVGALVVAACTSTTPGTGPSSPRSSAREEGPTFQLRAGGLTWSLRYPAAWHVEPYRAECMDWGGPGVIISNTNYVFHNEVVPNGCTNQWVFAGVPASLVAVDLEPAVVGPAVISSQPHTPLPLSLSLDHPAPRPAPSPGTDVREYAVPIVARGGLAYQAYVWVGPRATSGDIALAQRVVSTIRHS